ncbi:hypothetical protein SynSYN20_00674 [Synechococcus sp. SYN20]|nr:hypothetical protein SynSYN20_00674 [Synechococcus sp. SYN20]
MLTTIPRKQLKNPLVAGVMWFVACLCLKRRHSQDLQYRQLETQGEHAAPGGAYREATRFACSVPWRISLSRPRHLAGDACHINKSTSNVY